MDLTGQTLGKYEIKELLGSGGMAEVYKGRDTRLERPVAIKVMHPHLAKSADFQSRFLREAKATASLQHPNIVNLIDFDNEDDLFYMVMEFIEGGTLEDFLRINSPLDIEKAIDITRQVAAGLEYAHGKNMVHRDIKPANIMFADEAKERIVITDFGVTKLLDEEKMTMTGTMLGTPQYMAPEVVKGDEADQRADIYSLGTMLYEMVTGQVPFVADTPYGVLIKQTNEPVPSPRELSPDLPLDVEEALYKALEKEPENRFGSTAAFESALRGVTGSRIGPSFSNTIQQPLNIEKFAKSEQAEPPAWRKWIPLIGAGLAVAFIAGLTVSMLSFFGEDDPDEIAENVSISAVVEEIADELIEDDEEVEDTESIPTLAATEAAAVIEPTLAPTTIPTVEPTLEPTPIPIGFNDFDFESSPAFVCKIDYNVAGGVVGLEFDDLSHPPGGKQYVAWLANSADNRFVNLGIVSSDRFLAADFFRTLDSVSPEQFDRIVLSAELDGGSPEAPSDIIFDGVIDPATFDIQTELLSGNVRPGLEQYALAVQHSGLSADSLAQGNLAEARRHAEHVVNILEGEAGPNFGDLDNDGQAQNPGNGVGVFGYLLGARDLLTNAEPINPSSPIFFVQNGIDSSIANSNANADEAVDFALKLFAVDTADEGLNVVDDLLNSVLAGIEGQDLDGNTVVDPMRGEGGLQTVESLTVEWIEGSYFPDHLLDRSVDQVGRVRLATVNDVPLSGIELDLYPVPAVDDPSTGYFVFLISNEGQEVVNLGQVEPENFRINEKIPAGDIFLAKFDEVVIAIDPLPSDGGEISSAPTNVIYTAEFGAEQQASLFRVVQSNEGEIPLLASVVFESDLANQHVEFMIAALESGDLTLARRHAEHVNNILVGDADDRFGDVDGNGTVENPSETGIGAMVFHNQMETELLSYAAVPESLNARSRFYGTTVVPATLFNQASQFELVLEQIGKLLSTDTVGEAGPFASQGSTEMVSILTGKDFDGNGVVDVKEGEGGVVGFEFLLHLLTDRSFSTIGQP